LIEFVNNKLNIATTAQRRVAVRLDEVLARREKNNNHNDFGNSYVVEIAYHTF
jgi:hypothetical protein